MIGLVAGAAVLVAVASPPGEAWELRNEHWLVRGRGAVIEQAQGDPQGRGRHGARFAGTLFAGDAPPTGGKVVQAGKERVTIRGASFLTEPQTSAVRAREQSVRLEPGGRLGQSFRAPAGLARVAVCLPTWYSQTSAATLTLRRGVAEGEVVASRRLREIADNGWVELSCAPQPAGEFWLELTNPQGPVGWWAERGNPRPEGTAYVNGVAQPELDFDLEATAYRERAGELAVALEGPRLVVTPGLQGLRMRLVTPWQGSGYGLEPASSHWFRRFISDRGQYLPAQQLKRRGTLDFGMGAGQWLHLGGTQGADWHLEPFVGGLDFAMNGGELTLLLGEGLTVKVMPEGWRPAFLPRFTASDQKLSATLNDFLWERALSWPLDPGLPDWMEWLGLIRDWMGLPGYLERERAHLLAYRIMDDGYVYTWGDKPEWPFPDNDKYDARHFTTNANFILGSYRYLCWSGDREFLRANLARLGRAMEFQLRDCLGAQGQLVMTSPDHDGTSAGLHSNYWDDIPFGYRSAYENIYFCESLWAMAQMERVAGNRERARYLQELFRRAVGRYREEFWNERAGRFIGCIDREGVVHDYGFSYVNLEAMAYGLATPEQAGRIYRWLEQGLTESGKADTYSAYRFAPRANTLDCSGWWYLQGKAEIPSQPFGKHLENGGAILYTSGFDLLARARYLGPDNAYQRLQEILARFSEPDRLCGGPPLGHGENNGWEVGTDIPFPESGLAPAAFLYAFLGVQATPEGLLVRPRLPAALKWAGVEGLVYRGLPLDIRVSAREVRVSCRQPGYRFDLVQPIAPGGSFLLSRLPGDRQFPPRPARARWQAKWIWHPGASEKPGTVLLRRSFQLARRPLRAIAWMAVDNACELYVNGKRAGATGGWQRARRLDIGKLLVAGPNVLAVRAVNGDGPAGLLVEVQADGLTVASDGSWRSREGEVPGWEQPGFDDRGWTPAQELGPVPLLPWGEVGK